MTIAERIREARKAAGLTQQELAEKLGITPALIGHYERNIRNPKLEQLQKIASALCIPLNELINTGDLPWEKKGDSIQKYTEALNKALLQLTPEDALPLLVALETAIDYVARGSDGQVKVYAHRLSDIVASYGQMIMSGFSMKFASIKKPNDYHVFLRNYVKMIELVNEHKEDLIKGAIDWWEDDKDKLKLRKLIYGSDKEGDDHNAT